MNVNPFSLPKEILFIFFTSLHLLLFLDTLVDESSQLALRLGFVGRQHVEGEVGRRIDGGVMMRGGVQHGRRRHISSFVILFLFGILARGISWRSFNYT